MSSSTRIAAGRPWSAEEDTQLRAAVALHGENDNWKMVAEMVPGRTNKACRKRWRHSLSPGVKKSAWTAEEDKLLCDLHEKHGDKWSVIAREIEGRTDDACSKRYREALDPSLRKDDWTQEDDDRLLELHAQLAGQWRLIGAALCRGSLACRNRWRLFERKQRRLAQLSKYAITDLDISSATQDLSFGASWMQPAAAPACPTAYSACDPLMTYQTQEHATHYPVEQDCFIEWPWDNAAAPHQPLATHPTTSDDHALNQDPPIPPFPSQYEYSIYQDPQGGGDGSYAYWSHMPGGTVGAPATPLTVPPETPFDASNTSSPELIAPSTSRYGIDERVHEPHETNSSSSLTDASSCQSAMPLVPPPSPHGMTLPELSPSSNTSTELPSCDTLWDSPSSDLCPLTPLLPTPQTKQADLPRVHVAGEHEDIIVEHATTGLLGAEPSETNVAPAEKETPPDMPHCRSGGRKRRLSGGDEPAAKRKAVELRMDQGRVMQPGLLPYVCGHASCWSASSSFSLSRFDTARELGEHMRKTHVGEGADHVEKPYRCGLSSCGKAWKNLNGLQYHLQVAEDHYKKAMMFKAKVTATATDAEPAQSEGSSGRVYPCPDPDCCKLYKHASGLRYHRIHVHNGRQPEQISVLPPSVGKKVPRKARQPRTPAIQSTETQA